MTDWVAIAKGTLRAEMRRRDLSYADLVAMLADAGVKESEANLRNKVSRGSFTAAFMLQCLSVMGAKTLHLDQGWTPSYRRKQQPVAARYIRIVTIPLSIRADVGSRHRVCQAVNP